MVDIKFAINYIPWIFLNDKEYICSISITIDIFNDSWKLAIIWLLFESDKRYKELNIAIPNISQKTLTSKLKELETKGLISREDFHYMTIIYKLLFKFFLI